MAYLGTRLIPSFTEVMNVARETVRSFTPDHDRVLENARNWTRRVQYHAPDGNDGELGETVRIVSLPTDPAKSGYSQIQSLPNYGGIDNEAVESVSELTAARQRGIGNELVEAASQQQPRRIVYQFSFATGSIDLGDEDHGERRLQIDQWQAAWNVTNAIQGMFIVSLPYAVRKGGVYALISMVGIAYICCETGKMLIVCLYEIDLKTGQLVRVRKSYVDISKVVLGPRRGPIVVNSCQMIELKMTCILYIVVCGDLLSGTTGISERHCMTFTGVLLIPLAFFKSIHYVSTMSFYSTMTHGVINVVLVGYCLFKAPDWDFTVIRLSLNLSDFPIFVGIIVFSYTSHIFLPSLEGNMRDRSRFNEMLNWSHVAAAIFKVLFGLILFVTFKMDTQQVITNNLESVFFRTIVDLCLFAKAMLSFPLPFYAVTEIMEKNFEPYFGKPAHADGKLKKWSISFRLGVLFIATFLAIIIPHFAVLMGFVGSLTGTMLSFILPAWFHLYLKGDQLPLRTIIFDWVIIIMGVLFCVFGVIDSGIALIEAFQIGVQSPFNVHRRFKTMQDFSINATTTTTEYYNTTTAFAV